MKLEKLYATEYFENRGAKNDPLREKSYSLEVRKVLEYVERGSVLDIGCAMGEFLDQLSDTDWVKYGVEISEEARVICEQKKISILSAEEIDIDFEKFDLIILRGVIQHLDEPFRVLKKCYNALRPGGVLCLLATPNSNSIVYKVWGDLPPLDAKRNFYVPSDISLKNSLENLGFYVDKVDYPYLESPYASPFKDHLFFFLKFFGFNKKFAFWKNMMEVYAIKEK